MTRVGCYDIPFSEGWLIVSVEISEDDTSVCYKISLTIRSRVSGHKIMLRTASHYGRPSWEVVGLNGQTLWNVQRNGLKIINKIWDWEPSFGHSVKSKKDFATVSFHSTHEVVVIVVAPTNTILKVMIFQEFYNILGNTLIFLKCMLIEHKLFINLSAYHRTGSVPGISFSGVGIRQCIQLPINL
jgi:hypothetical protein